MTSQSDYRVRAVSCDHRASDEEVYQALKRATDPLGPFVGPRFARPSASPSSSTRPGPRSACVYLDGLLQELVDFKVARATLRLIREHNPSAELTCTEISTNAHHDKKPVEPYITLMPAPPGVRRQVRRRQPAAAQDLPGARRRADVQAVPAPRERRRHRCLCLRAKDEEPRLSWASRSASRTSSACRRWKSPTGARAPISTTSCACPTCWWTWRGSSNPP